MSVSRNRRLVSTTCLVLCSIYFIFLVNFTWPGPCTFEGKLQQPKAISCPAIWIYSVLWFLDSYSIAPPLVLLTATMRVYLMHICIFKWKEMHWISMHFLIWKPFHICHKGGRDQCYGSFLYNLAAVWDYIEYLKSKLCINLKLHYFYSRWNKFTQTHLWEMWGVAAELCFISTILYLLSHFGSVAVSLCGFIQFHSVSLCGYQRH